MMGAPRFLFYFLNSLTSLVFHSFISLPMDEWMGAGREEGRWVWSLRLFF